MHGDRRSNKCQTAVGIDCEADNLSFMSLFLGNGEFYCSLYGNWRHCMMCEGTALYEKAEHFMYNFENVIMSKHHLILRKSFK